MLTEIEYRGYYYISAVFETEQISIIFWSHIILNYLFVELKLCQYIVYRYSYIIHIITSIKKDILEIEIGNCSDSDNLFDLDTYRLCEAYYFKE